MDETRETNYQGVFDNRVGFGARPCVLVIDFIKAYTTKGAAFFGQGVVDAVDATVGLLAVARSARVPIIYTKVLYHPSGIDGGLFVKKVPALRRSSPVSHSPKSIRASRQRPKTSSSSRTTRAASSVPRSPPR